MSGKNKELIKDKTQVTLERETDFLAKVYFENTTKTCTFHGEFHVKSENLGSWMLLNRAILRHKYHLPIRQVVFYIGGYTGYGLENRIEELNLSFSFEVIVLKTYPTKYS